MTPRKSAKNRRRYIGGLSALAIAAAVTAGFMSTSTAIAEGGDDTVTFNGSCGALGTGLLNESKPDKSQMYVTEGDKITFVNNLGNDATLHFGKKEYDLGDGDEKALTVDKSIEAVLVPDCAVKLDDHSEPATLNVTPASNPGDDNGSGDGDNSGGGSDNGGGSDDNDGGDVGVPHDGNQPPDDPAASGHVPDPGADDDKPSDDSSSDSQDDTVVPPPADDDTPSTDTSQAGQVEAADTSSQSQGASGMLALLAAVCLVGVGVAAVRTMVANRSGAAA